MTVPDKSQLSLCAHVLLLLPPVFQLWPHSDSDSELCFTLCNYSSDESRRIKVVFVVARQKLMMLLEKIHPVETMMSIFVHVQNCFFTLIIMMMYGSKAW